MALSKAQKDKVDEADVYPVTEAAPSQDDKVGAVIGDASPEDSPVRTQHPDKPVAAVMVGGVGSHKPVESDKFDRDGRFVGDVELADNTDASAREKR